MSSGELLSFHRLLPKYLLWQSERIRQYPARPIEEITVRDCQAMYNFSQEGIDLETIAEHFGCSVEYVSTQVEKRPWLHTRPTTTYPDNISWLESDHSDPLELVKLFYTTYLPEEVSTETTAKEAQRESTWREYLETVDHNEVYEAYGDRYIDVIKERAQEIADESGVELVWAD